VARIDATLARRVASRFANRCWRHVRLEFLITR
jgi:hypothetical protein